MLPPHQNTLDQNNYCHLTSLVTISDHFTSPPLSHQIVKKFVITPNFSSIIVIHYPPSAEKSTFCYQNIYPLIIMSTPHLDTLYQINYCHPSLSSHVTPILLQFIIRPHKRPYLISPNAHPISRFHQLVSSQHHSVSPQHQSVHQTPSVSFTRTSSELREVFRFLILNNSLYEIYHIIIRNCFILLYTNLWYIYLCLLPIIVNLPSYFRIFF